MAHDGELLEQKDGNRIKAEPSLKISKLIGKWGQMIPTFRRLSWGKAYRFYQKFIKDVTGGIGLFTKFFGNLSLRTFLGYLEPKRRNSMRKFFIMAGEEEQWPMVKGFLEKMDGNRSSSKFS